MKLKTKVCKKCKKRKPLTEFHKDSYSPDGHHFYCKECRHKNYKKYYGKNKDKKRKQYRENAEYYRFYRRMQRYTKVELTFGEWNELLKEYNHSCAYCGEKYPFLQIEHVIPYSKGGTTSKENIVPACPNCNTIKQRMTLTEFHEQFPEKFSEERYEKLKQRFHLER